MTRESNDRPSKAVGCNYRQNCTALLLFIPLGVFACLCVSIPELSGSWLIAQDREASAIRQILGEVAFEQAAESICRQTRRLKPQARYTALLRHVVPEFGPLRLEAAFTPTDPAPNSGEALSISNPPATCGGQLVSPALDLVEVATEINQLDALLEAIEAAPRGSLIQNKKQSALRILIFLSQQDIAAALTELDHFSRLCAELQPADLRHCASELVVFERCVHDPACSELAIPLIERVIGQLRSQQDQSIWYRQVVSLRGVAAQLSSQKDVVDRATESQWHWASVLKAETRGLGLPGSQWRLTPGHAENVISHGDDFLYFASPLQGSYQIECDSTSFNWMETRPFAAGLWVSPIHTMNQYEVAELGYHTKTLPIQPPLTKTYDFIHLRMTVDQETVQAFANGRLIHRQPVDKRIDPWLGIRSGFLVNGEVSNVRVTGSPEIPASIDLMSGSSMVGWNSYFQDTTDPFRWRRTGDEITGIHEPGLRSPSTSACLEEALFYHRPMLENGTIEYEFFYQPADSSRTGPVQVAHVALDRLCLLMQPEGVAVHWMTDGRFDRTELAPENAVVVPAFQRSTGALPLQAGEWNQAALTVNGDALSLTLNGQLVFVRPIESTNQRRFGFFFFTDQEQLRVRNIRWTGDWPKTLPAIADQPLALPEGDFLDEDQPRLVSVFDHDFAQDGLPEDRLATIHGTLGKEFSPVADGIQATISGPSGYRNATLAPQIRIHGDFDVIAEYDHLTTDPRIQGSSSIMLIANFENLTRDEGFITRRHTIAADSVPEQIVQCVTVKKTSEGEQRDYFSTKPMEESRGRLKLSRRGDKMFYLSAEGDSPNFRLRGTRDVARDPIQMGGLRLLTQIHGEGSTGVVWKRLSVRSEQITGDATGAVDERIVELNQQRDKLPVHVVFDMAQAAPMTTSTYRWGDLRPWQPENGGLPILARGTKEWTSSGITLLQPIEGDFDLRAEFQIQNLAEPISGDGTSIFLQCEADDDLQTQFNAVHNLTSAGAQEFESQIRTRHSNGELSYQNEGRRNAKNAVALRVARRGRIVTVLGTPDAAANECVISRFESHDAAITSAKILLHTGIPGRDSDIVLKALRIDADRYAPIPDVLHEGRK